MKSIGLAFVVALAGCGAPHAPVPPPFLGGSDPKTLATFVVGRWCPDAKLSIGALNVPSPTLTFDADGTVRYQHVKSWASGKWTSDGSAIHLSFDKRIEVPLGIDRHARAQAAASDAMLAGALAQLATLKVTDDGKNLTVDPPPAHGDAHWVRQP